MGLCKFAWRPQPTPCASKNERHSRWACCHTRPGRRNRWACCRTATFQRAGAAAAQLQPTHSLPLEGDSAGLVLGRTARRCRPLSVAADHHRLAFAAAGWCSRTWCSGACRTNCGSCESWRPIHIRGAMRELRSPCPAFLPRPHSDALRYRARSRPPCLHAWPSKASEAMQAAGSEPRAITGLNRDSECPPLLLVKVCAVNRPLQCSHGVSHNSERGLCRSPPPRRGLDP